MAKPCEFEVYIDSGGEWRWRLQDTNNEIIADSAEGYSSRQACMDGIQNVRDCVPTATINDKS